MCKFIAILLHIIAHQHYAYLQGTIIATGSMDNTAKLWDVETGAELHTLLVGHGGYSLSNNPMTNISFLFTGPHS